jgi:hypothetical protein
MFTSATRAAGGTLASAATVSRLRPPCETATTRSPRSPTPSATSPAVMRAAAIPPARSAATPAASAA